MTPQSIQAKHNTGSKFPFISIKGCSNSFSREPYKNPRKGYLLIRTCLPKPLIELVEREYPKYEVAHRLIHIIATLFIQHEPYNDTIIDVSRNYILAILNGNRNYYYLFSRILVEEYKILLPVPLSNKTGYSWGKGECKKYKFNPKYLADYNMETIYYERVIPSRSKTNARLRELEPITKEVFDRTLNLSLAKSPEYLKELITQNYYSVWDKVTSRTKTHLNGNVHYYNGNDRTIYPKNIIDKMCGMEPFYVFKTSIIIESQIQSLEKISKLHLLLDFPTRDTKAKRLYHVLTNMDSDLLQYIKLYNEPLVEIDLKNSQFTLLCNCIRVSTINGTIHIPTLINNLYRMSRGENIYRRGTAAHSGLGEERQGVYINRGTATHSGLGDEWQGYLCSHLSIDFIPYSKDIDEIVKASFKGRLYETIGKRLYGKDGLSAEERDEVKLTCFALLFGDYAFSESSNEKQSFKKAYSGFAELIVRIKQYFDTMYRLKDPRLVDLELDYQSLGYSSKGIGYRKAGSNLLSIMLSRIETIIFIEDILVELYQKGLDVLPKHDSILAKVSHAHMAEAIIRERLNVLLGVGKYKLKRKKY